MHFITDNLLVGNISDATEPPPQISAVLLVAAEFSIQPPSWFLFGRIPFSEYAEAEPGLLDRAVSWVEQHLVAAGGRELILGEQFAKSHEDEPVPFQPDEPHAAKTDSRVASRVVREDDLIGRQGHM